MKFIIQYVHFLYHIESVVFMHGVCVCDVGPDFWEWISQPLPIDIGGRVATEFTA